MQTVSSPTNATSSHSDARRSTASTAAAIDALQRLDNGAFLDVVLREAARRHEELLPIGRSLANDLWSEACSDVFPAPRFDESVWAELMRDGRWSQIIESAARDLRSQASLVVDVVVDARCARDDGPSYATARRYAFDDEE